jgi:hypothetical protein
MPGRSVRAVRVRQNPLAWFYRWALGRPLNGAARTNASFLHPATKNESGYFHPMFWHRSAQWRVAVFRWAVTVWFILAIWGRATGDWVTPIIFAIMVATPFLYYWLPKLYDIRHYRSIVFPMAKALGPLMGIDKTPAGMYIDVNRTFVKRIEGHPATIAIPHSLAGQVGVRRNMMEAVYQVLATNEHELTLQWMFFGPKPKLVCEWAPAPPPFVDMELAVSTLRELKPSQVFIGFGRRSEPILVDLDNESPHLMESMGTGAGKSALARSIVAQLLHNGAHVVSLDIKRISHKWLESIPRNVKYAKNIADIHDLCLYLGEELDRRNAIADAGNDVGPPLIALVEEMNMLTNRLKAYWQDIREKGEPKNSPAIRALNELLFAGRAVKMHAILIGQYLTANSVGGTEARENLGYRLMGRYSPQSWRNLAGDIPMPPPSRHPGRIQVISEGIARECQTLFMTDSEAIAWATSNAGLMIPPNSSSGPGMNGLIVPRRNWKDNAEEIKIDGLAKLLREMNTGTESGT